ncbi:J domain-containing protein required for chloroplast accumulation response 1 isoform X2 [Lotus japonicus]|uniref:J domain-containing protein required for chloroplast accumulation response 1 isoform X2 n=1 Tax=Lotus japonicus TaxID=34305 RepID=UPI00258B3BBC|nr:J domain-containing protein required for chloroplast accumulation response 1 isoform X2 [Lotus japonicus]
METFNSSQRESIVLGHNNLLIRRPSERNSDVDFNDVFGGPPRRSTVNSEGVSGEEGEEKPVFGGEDNGSSNRRRYYASKSDDFYDDIFGGDECRSACSTPKRRDSAGADPFSSAAVLSPAALEPLAFSLPPVFSLPAKLTKGVDLRRLGSPTSRNINDGITASNLLVSPDSHSSRVSTVAPQRKELKNDIKPPYRQSILSQEFSNLSTSDKADKGISNMKQETSVTEVSPNTFHFSIYKWASKGVVPVVMPLRTERISRMKDKVKHERCSSTEDWVVSDITTENDNPVPHNGSSLTENGKQNVSTTSATDSDQIVEQIVSSNAQPDTLSSAQTISKNVTEAESSTHSMSEMNYNGKTEAGIGTQKLGSKSLHSLINQREDYGEKTSREREEHVTKSTKKLSSTFDVTMNPKKPLRKSFSLRDGGHSKATSQVSSSLGENMGKGRVKGKVKDFVQIFNQEPVTKPKVESKSRFQSSSYKQRRASRTNNNVEDDPEQSTTEKSATDTANVSANNFSQQDDISASAIPDISFTVIGDKDESFHDNFTIQVLDQDDGEALQNQEKQQLQVIDNKIQQWSKGKEGNMRSLLSTLQHLSF